LLKTLACSICAIHVQPLNLFYEEPDHDRWLPLDRYPRRVFRRMVRGETCIGGQQRVFVNLCAGLDLLGVPYRVNDYHYARRHGNELACIIGKPHVLDKMPWKNPILFGAAVFSHPLSDTNVFKRLPVKRVLVPGEWMRRMWEPYYGDRVSAWPVGIDTERWKPAPTGGKDLDFLLYNKIRWHQEEFEAALLTPIRRALSNRRLTFAELCYGHYEEHEFHDLLRRSRAMVFVCEHETQGIAYQQALSCGVPILAWDRGGFWQDPEFYPHKVQFEPVSSVPYWDERCGMKFTGTDEFPDRLDEFCEQARQGGFQPRNYILENLALDLCAKRYLEFCENGLWDCSPPPKPSPTCCSPR
jgi:glycosyltransferase involved in cell wall biosynthesis